MLNWSHTEAVAYFESGGTDLPADEVLTFGISASTRFSAAAKLGKILAAEAKHENDQCARGLPSPWSWPPGAPQRGSADTRHLN